MNYQARIFVDTFGLDPHVSRVLVLCPFHTDSKGASLSINLDKALYYCFGACTPPKGGGAVQFIMKLAKLNGHPLTYDQARRQLARAFRIPSASVLAQEHRDAELVATAKRNAARAQRTLRALDNDAAWLSLADPNDDATWDALEDVHKLTSLIEWIADEFGVMRPQPTPVMTMLRDEIVRRGWGVGRSRPSPRSLLSPDEWKCLAPSVELAHRTALSGDAWTTLIHEGMQAAQAHVTRQYVKKGESCRPRPRPKRTPIRPVRTAL